MCIGLTVSQRHEEQVDHMKLPCLVHLLTLLINLWKTIISIVPIHSWSTKNSSYYNYFRNNYHKLDHNVYKTFFLSERQLKHIYIVFKHIIFTVYLPFTIKFSLSSLYHQMHFPVIYKIHCLLKYLIIAQ